MRDRCSKDQTTNQRHHHHQQQHYLHHHMLVGVIQIRQHPSAAVRGWQYYIIRF